MNQHTSQRVLAKLATLRSYGGATRSHGLSDATLSQLVTQFPDLVEAVDAAHAQFEALRGGEFDDILRADETTQIAAVQAGFVNFYPDDAVNPYVSLAARGPWIVTLKGAVIHDNGGYGMLGAGHTPAAVLEAMSRPQVMEIGRAHV